jgi:hypothetical protein
MHPSSFFKFKKLVDQPQPVFKMNNNNNGKNVTNQHDSGNDYSSNSISDTDATSITNNLEEFKILFNTQEKACYELRSENTILKLKLEAANEMIKSQSKKIQSLKMKKNKLQIENNVYKNVIYASPLSFNSGNHSHNHHNANDVHMLKCIKNEEHVSHAYPPPPPPPLPLPPLNKIRANGNFHMNNVLDELKSKIKKIDE